MPRTSYDPVLDAHAPQSGGLYPAPVRPWWETMGQDPWYITGAKAVLGEREVEELRTGDIEPWIATLAPLLFMGKGSKRMPGAGELEGRFYDWMFGTGPSKSPPPPPTRTYDPDVFVPGKPFDPETFVTEPPGSKSWGNVYDRKYSGPLQGQQWADLYATPDVEFTAKPPETPYYKTKMFGEMASSSTTWGQLGPEQKQWFLDQWKLGKKPNISDMPESLQPPPPPLKPLDPIGELWTPESRAAAAAQWTKWNRGLLPWQKGEPHGNIPFDIESLPTGPRPDVPPPYNFQSPLKITPEDVAGVPTPPGIKITPEEVGQLTPKDDSPAAELERILYWGGGKAYYPYTAEEAFNIQKLGLKPPELSTYEYQRAYDQFIQKQATQTGDGHEVPGGLFFKNQFPGYQIDYQHGIPPQPEVPARFLPPAPDPTPPPTFDFSEFGYVEPQMRFYPQTDWMQQLYQSQFYPDELNWRVA